MIFLYKTLIIQGTTSDAGKTTLVAALCRLLAHQGFKAVPFKPQNMALNRAVTVDGGEIGRGQALQAFATGLPPHTDMNSILLKPSSDVGAQVIVHGQVRADMNARDYHQYKILPWGRSWNRINACIRSTKQSFWRGRAAWRILIVGEVAHIFGTLDCILEIERARVLGFVINRFRGDISLLQGGLDWLEQRTGKPVFGSIAVFAWVDAGCGRSDSIRATR